MKLKLIILIAFLSTLSTVAQQAINYKALIKDDLGNVMANQAVTVQFTILEGAAAATVYQEDHAVNTDANGIAIVNIGAGNILNGDYNTIDWGADDHFLNVQIDSGDGLVDLGTTQFMSVPYALYAETSGSGGSGTEPTGLEALDEGNGDGWRLIGRNPANYGDIGLDASDLSTSTNDVENRGATGDYSFAAGWNTIASGIGSTALGWSSDAVGSYSLAMGRLAISSGNSSVALGVSAESIGTYTIAIGNGTNVTSTYSIALGRYNVGGGNLTQWIGTDPIFEIGNGTSVAARSNALTVLKNGTITAPSFDISEIIDPKALITKEYLDANSSAATGLEALDEGNGDGWRLIGRSPNYYGNIGEDAVDVSYANSTSDTYGATGGRSFSSGFYTTASGQNSIAMGYYTVASGPYSTAIGYDSDATASGSLAFGSYNLASGNQAVAFGYESIASGNGATVFGLRNTADDYYATVVGKYNDSSTGSIMFQVGNGGSDVTRTNALNVFQNGAITAPTFDVSEITNPKSLVTKEYIEGNYIGIGSTNAPSGLEAIDEGNGIGWRIIDRVASAYGPIGLSALDFSYAAGGSNSFGALGAFSTALGFSTIASGNGSTAIGNYTIADEASLTVVGKYNDPTASTTKLFQVGNGADNFNRSNAFTVFESGNAALAGTLTQSSDRRLKQDINTINYGLSEVLKLKPVSYHWKKHPDQPISLGLIAQDIQPIIKEIVHQSEDKNKTLSVSYIELIPVLIKAIQEQQVIIESQKQTIQNQEQASTEQSALLQALLNRVEALEKDKIGTNVELVKN